MSAVKELPTEVTDALRHEFARPEDDTWVSRLAAEAGWQVANRRYLASMRERGVREMLALMRAAGVKAPVPQEEVLQLVEAAVSLHEMEATTKRVVNAKGQPSLVIRVANCSIYARMQEFGWHGVTACGCWHRRQGWYDALGVVAEDMLVGAKKWGGVACAAVVKLCPAPPTQPEGKL